MLKKFLKYVSFNILGMIGLSCYILVDTFFVAQKLESVGVAALNFAIPVYTIINGIGLMVGIGGATKFSIDKETKGKASPIFMNCLVVGTAISIILFITGFLLSKNISYFLGADNITIDYTNIYVKMILMFSPFYILNNIIIAFVKNDGFPQLSMTAMLISSFSNIILDYVFMYIFDMKMFGAVLATCLSPIISLLILSIHFIRKKNTFSLCRFKLSFNTVAKIISYGFSSFVSELASSVSLTIFNLILVNSYGRTSVAAYGIIANIALVGISVFTGISQGSQPLISASCGKNDHKEIKTITKYTTITSLIFSIIMYLVLFIFSKEIVSIFSSNEKDLTKIAVLGTKIYFIGFIFAGINISVSSIFSASLRYKTAMLISLLRSCIVLIPTVIICNIFGELLIVWLSYPITEFIVFIITLISLIKYNSYNKKLQIK